MRELIKQECLKDQVRTPKTRPSFISLLSSARMSILMVVSHKIQERRKREEAEKNSEEGSEAKEEVSEERGITLRPLSMEDMKVAKSQVKLKKD